MHGPPPRSAAFLLAQIGAHAAARFAERLARLDLQPFHAGILRALVTQPGISQQQLASFLGMLPSRLVPILDEMEERGLVERRDQPEDRRQYALFLSARGHRVTVEIGKIALEHDEATCAALDERERRQLRELLERVAAEQGLTPGVHPGFSKLGGGGPTRKR